jgi:hypothetical protein
MEPLTAALLEAVETLFFFFWQRISDWVTSYSQEPAPTYTNRAKTTTETTQ